MASFRKILNGIQGWHEDFSMWVLRGPICLVKLGSQLFLGGPKIFCDSPGSCKVQEPIVRNFCIHSRTSSSFHLSCNLYKSSWWFWRLSKHLIRYTPLRLSAVSSFFWGIRLHACHFKGHLRSRSDCFTHPLFPGYFFFSLVISIKFCFFPKLSFAAVSLFVWSLIMIRHGLKPEFAAIEILLAIV